MADEQDKITLTTLTRKQRRVLGTLVEKGLTTPDQYPLTLKATTTGCNQKSNRDPVTEYDEDAVQQTLDQLREMGLVGEVHTEGGRTSRFRHYMRQKTTLSEPQLAIMTELMLRGRQQLGELRTRASRMHEIDSQEKLKAELQLLVEAGLVRTNGPLERRGVEVDHNLYPPGENREELSPLSEADEPVSRPAAVSSPRPTVTVPSPDANRVAALEAIVGELKDELTELRNQVGELRDALENLRRQLGA